jgi:methionine aminopeptidase
MTITINNQADIAKMRVAGHFSEEKLDYITHFVVY